MKRVFSGPGWPILHTSFVYGFDERWHDDVEKFNSRFSCIRVALKRCIILAQCTIECVCVWIVDAMPNCVSACITILLYTLFCAIIEYVSLACVRNACMRQRTRFSPERFRQICVVFVLTVQSFLFSHFFSLSLSIPFIESFFFAKVPITFFSLAPLLKWIFFSPGCWLKQKQNKTTTKKK